VARAGKKLEIELEDGESRKVRAKDVVLLHPGEVGSVQSVLNRPELALQPGELEAARELLEGATISLAELAELVYGDYSPATAWAAWQVVTDGLYFSGSPEDVVARSAEAVAEELSARRARDERARAWEAFLKRVRAGEILPEDSEHLREVEDLALGRVTKCRLLRELGRAESRENGHALLLELGYWDHTVDPYPHRFGLPTVAVKVELPELPDEARVDLTQLPAFAIDDEGNQEPDDALSLEDGRLWVHVADVAALVPPDSAADLAARDRGYSLYLPEGTVPMLPWEAILRLGLGLEDISPALSFGLDLTAAGEISAVEVVPSWVRVTRLTYAESEGRLEEEPFDRLYRLAMLFQGQRRKQGAIEIELPEVKIWLQGAQVCVEPSPQLASRELVTEAMLMAGEAAARYALEHGILIPFTTQAPPEIDERPVDLAGMYALRRGLRPSEQSSQPRPHTGLGLEVYAQATSPLRRYLDLVVHQQLRAHLQGQEMLGAQEVLERIGAVAAVVGSVRRAERLARRHWTLVFLMQHPGWCGKGILVHKRGRRAVALVPDLDLEAWVHLPQDLPLNSPVQLALRGVDLAALEAHFQVVRDDRQLGTG
jgi:exoribonuclease-2